MFSVSLWFCDFYHGDTKFTELNTFFYPHLCGFCIPQRLSEISEIFQVKVLYFNLPLQGYISFISLWFCVFHHGGTKVTEFNFIFLVFSVSPWFYVFHHRGTKVTEFSSLCSLCLCGYVVFTTEAQRSRS